MQLPHATDARTWQLCAPCPPANSVLLPSCAAHATADTSAAPCVRASSQPHTACTLSTCVPLLNPRTPGRVGSDFDIDKGEVYREVTHKGEYVNVAKRSEAWCRTARVSTGAKLMAVEHVL